jgi:hypothetical protein
MGETYSTYRKMKNIKLYMENRRENPLGISTCRPRWEDNIKIDLTGKKRG